eukprot:298524-Amorphochlora_amoeboformis.AAC.1
MEKLAAHRSIDATESTKLGRKEWDEIHSSLRRSFRVTGTGRLQERSEELDESLDDNKEWATLDPERADWLRRLVDAMCKNIQLTPEISVSSSKSQVSQISSSIVHVLPYLKQIPSANNALCHYVIAYPGLLPTLGRNLEDLTSARLLELLAGTGGLTDTASRADIESTLSLLLTPLIRCSDEKHLSLAIKTPLLILGTLVRMHPVVRAAARSRGRATPLLYALVTTISDRRTHLVLLGLRAMAALAINGPQESMLFQGKKLDQTLHLVFNLICAPPQEKSDITIKSHHELALEILSDLMQSVRILARLESYPQLIPTLQRVITLLNHGDIDAVTAALGLGKLFLKSTGLRQAMFYAIAEDRKSTFWNCLRSLVLSSSLNAKPLNAALSLLTEAAARVPRYSNPPEQTSMTSGMFSPAPVTPQHTKTGEEADPARLFVHQFRKFSYDADIVRRLYDLCIGSSVLAITQDVQLSAVELLLRLCDLPTPSDDEKNPTTGSPACLVPLARDGCLRRLSEATITALSNRSPLGLSLAGLLIRASADGRDAESVFTLLEQDAAMPHLLATGLARGSAAALRLTSIACLRRAAPKGWWELLGERGCSTGDELVWDAAALLRGRVAAEPLKAAALVARSMRAATEKDKLIHETVQRASSAEHAKERLEE